MDSNKIYTFVPMKSILLIIICFLTLGSFAQKRKIGVELYGLRDYEMLIDTNIVTDDSVCIGTQVIINVRLNKRLGKYQQGKIFVYTNDNSVDIYYIKETNKEIQTLKYIIK